MTVAVPRDRWFYSGFALALVVIVAAGFTPTFYARGWYSAGSPLPAVVQLHGVLGTTWVVLFALQAALIARERVQWHRLAGMLGAVVAAAFVASGAVVIASFERTHGSEAPSVLSAHLFTNGAPLAAFGLLVAGGVWQRRVAARHKRLMLLAAVVLLPPAIGRLFGYLDLVRFNLPVYAAFALANAGYDFATRGRPHPIALLGGGGLVAIDVAATAWLAAVES